MLAGVRCVSESPFGSWHGAAEAVCVFVDRLMADDAGQINMMAADVAAGPGGRLAMLDFFIAATQQMGAMWEQDLCDFTTLTLAVYRLTRIIASTSPTAAGADGRRILLFAAPGEPHGFGLAIVAEVFREDGWSVSRLSSAKRRQLTALVKDEWFDVIGVSITLESCLHGLPSCIREICRASCNPAPLVMVGGGAVVTHPERLRFLGADATAANAPDALRRANLFMETEVTRRIHQFKTKTDDIRLAL